MQHQNHCDYPGLCLHAVGTSDVGRKRALNEDHFCIDEGLRLFLVADGMGGHATGEIASREAVKIIGDYVRNHQAAATGQVTDTQQIQAQDNDATLKDFSIISSEHDEDSTLEYTPNSAVPIITAALEHTNQHLHSMNRERGFPEGQGMGTTIAGIWLPEPLNPQAIIFHIGDSRIYRYRADKLQQLSQDHTLYQYWKDHGQVGPAPARNIIFRSLGPSSQVTADIQLQILHPDDLILICSDGLNAMVPDALIETALHQSQPNRLQITCEELAALANTRGGADNITLILAHCDHAPT